MKIWHWAASLVFLAGLGFAASNGSCSASAPTLAIPCNQQALDAAYHGVDSIDSLQSYGCKGDYAYIWATIGKGVHEIGVTEVLAYNVNKSAWKNVSREHYCVQRRLPAYVWYWGCNSN